MDMLPELGAIIGYGQAGFVFDVEGQPYPMMAPSSGNISITSSPRYLRLWEPNFCVD
jgi:hypothetical protein